jgi:predicted amidohydrolase
MVVMVVANYPEPKEDGNSCVCVPSGAIIAQAGVSEEILLATVDLAAVRKWRTTEVWGPKNS